MPTFFYPPKAKWIIPEHWRVSRGKPMTSKRKLNLRVSFSTADNLCGGRSPFSLYFMLIHSTVLVSVILFSHSSSFHYRLLRLCSLYLPVAGVKKNENENPCKEQVRHTTTIRSVNSRYEIAFLLKLRMCTAALIPPQLCIASWRNLSTCIPRNNSERRLTKWK